VKKKLIIVFLILTIVPAGLLGWLGVVSFRTEKERDLLQFEQLCGSRLEAVNLEIERLFLSLENELRELPGRSGADVERIRRITRENDLIRQVFLIGSDGELAYPAEGMIMSRREEEFLVRVREIAPSAGLFLEPAEEEGTLVDNKGWFTWYLGEGINFIYWQDFEGNENKGPDADGIALYGTELNRSSVFSHLIQYLPDTDFENPEQFRTVITDVNNTVFYQWGSYSPAPGEEPVSVVPVTSPLSSWRLQYFGNPDLAAGGWGRYLTIVAPIALVIIAMIGLSVYLYRESTREVREAMQKITFVNQVSHELKTPLTNIRMYAELLEGRIDQTDTKSRDYLGVVAGESRRLSRLINNVLTFAKQQRNGNTPRKASGVVDDVIESVVENFRLSLDVKGIETELNLNSKDEVLLDTDMLEQMVSNLISNVEKYAPSGKYLGISSISENSTTTIKVSDRGPGIPPSQRERVFKPFYRMSNKLTDSAAGTGIGLAIVRNLAKLHGGGVRIESSKEGTTFVLTLETPLVDTPRNGRIQHENTHS
jgi:signal transduction histidine kinase